MIGSWFTHDKQFLLKVKQFIALNMVLLGLINLEVCIECTRDPTAKNRVVGNATDHSL